MEIAASAREHRGRRHRLRRLRPPRGARRTSTPACRSSSSRARSAAPLGATCVLHGDGGRIVAAGGGRRDQLDADVAPRRGRRRRPPRARRDGRVDARRLAGARARPSRRARSSTGSSSAATTRAAGRRAADAGGRSSGSSSSAQTTRRSTQRSARNASRSWANNARDLANRPPNDLTPGGVSPRAPPRSRRAPTASRTRRSAATEIEALGMGAFAAVAQGSHNEPRLIVLRYDPPGARDGLVLGLVGKAITFDTGGISLKPAALHGGHEGRHGRRRGRDRGHRRDRRPGTSGPGAGRRRRRPRTWPAAAPTGPATSSRR